MLVPPVAEAVKPPLDNPLHVTFESTTIDDTNAVGSEITTEFVAVTELASVTVYCICCSS